MNYVLYHGKCYDGFGAAFAAWLKLGDKDTKYIPVSYGYPPPDMPDAHDVYILDFSYDEQTLRGIKDKCIGGVVLLDHHKTAIERIGHLTSNDIPGIIVVIDMSKSGALLAWNWFHPGIDTPMLIKYISDRDLWQFKHAGTKYVHRALVSYPMDFELWSTFLGDTSNLIVEGESLERLYSQLVSNIVNSAWTSELSGYEVPVVNTSIAWSEVGNELLVRYPDAHFAASFTVFENQIMWSLRSREDFDVSEIAKKFGGGGHKQAAGFKTPRF